MQSQTMDERMGGKNRRKQGNGTKATISVNGGEQHDLDSPEAKAEIEKVVKKAVSDAGVKDVGGVAGQRLLSFVNRVENMAEEIKGLQEDLKDIYAEAKGVGFDVPVLKAVIKKRKALRKNAQRYREQYELFELYQAAIGME